MVCSRALLAASGALAAQNPADTAKDHVRLAPPGAADSIHARADTGVQALTLADALRVAHENNPTFLQTIATAGAASASLRTAYGQLLPQLSASLYGAYGGSGQTVVSGSFLGASSNYLESQYQVGLNYTMNAATLLTRRRSGARIATLLKPTCPLRPRYSRAALRNYM